MLVKHHSLKAWKESIKLVRMVYEATGSFPKQELFGLTAQIWPSAVSVPSNIAEGAAWLTQQEFLRFLGIARGSLMELETQIIIAFEVGFLDAAPRGDLKAQIE